MADGKWRLAFRLSRRWSHRRCSAPADRRSASKRFAPLPMRRHCASFDDARARALLAETQILVTGWGCPPIDATVLEAAPRLRLIAHAAGSVKALVGPGVFARGITVVSAADANALPVAEFTVAAILFANKRVFDFAAAYRRERRGLELYVKDRPRSAISARRSASSAPPASAGGSPNCSAPMISSCCWPIH